MKITNFRGDLTDISAKKEALFSRLCAVRRTGSFSRAGAWDSPRHTGTELRGMSDADALSYLIRMTVPVIGK